jgi:hypothetical protein
MASKLRATNTRKDDFVPVTPRAQRLDIAARVDQR